MNPKMHTLYVRSTVGAGHDMDFRVLPPLLEARLCQYLAGDMDLVSLYFSLFLHKMQMKM